MKMTSKRFFAYIIDMIIILGIVGLISFFLPSNPIQSLMSNLNEQYLSQSMSFSTYMSSFMDISQQLDKANIGITIFSLIVIVVFSIIIPYLKNGQTIGCKILKIKIVSDKKLELEDLVGRSVILNGLGYTLIMIIILYFTNAKLYFIFMNILAFFQIMLVIINGFMVLYKEKHLGIADKITKTRIEEIK